jgi:hypothetical protein
MAATATDIRTLATADKARATGHRRAPLPARPVAVGAACVAPPDPDGDLRALDRAAGPLQGTMIAA